MRNFRLLALTLMLAVSSFQAAAQLALSVEDTGPTFTHYPAPSSLLYATAAAEPSIGVNWNTGEVMYQAYAGTFRITFNESYQPPQAKWALVKPPTSIVNVDPILFTDHVTGRTFAGGLDGACSVLAYTDDDGKNWMPMTNACSTPSFDHPTIGSGPWAETIAGLPRLYDRAVYYCAQALIAQCAVSHDGGLTFGPGVPVYCTPTPGLHGSVHVGPDGWAYLPFRRCGPGVAVSGDNGVTWTARPIHGAGPTPAAAFDPDVATTTSGWAYVAYPTANFGVGVALTKNHGLTWTNFGDVAASAGIMSSTFHEMVAGDDERAAVVYLGSTTGGNPHATSFAGQWHVYVSYTHDAGATWTTIRTSDNIIQKRWICADGLSCNSGRNLLDFIDAQVDARGRIVAAVADGCISTCETGNGPSSSGWATIVRQTGGRTLFRAHDPQLPPDAPILDGVSTDGQVNLSWSEPNDHGHAIVNYTVFRDGTPVSRTVQKHFSEFGLENGRTYTYEVSASSEVGEGARSSPITLTPMAPPGSPTGLKAEHEGKPNSGSIELKWQPPEDDGGSSLLGYNVYRSTANMDEALVAQTRGTNHTDEGLEHGREYTYRVAGYNSVGEGPRSSPSNATG